MAATDISPNTDNYAIFTGIVTWTPLLGVERDVGNVSEFQLAFTVTRQPHFSSRGGLGGVSFQDSNPVTRVAMTVTMKMEEITASNLQLALLATQSTNHLDIAQSPNIQGALKLTGTNFQGAKVLINLPDCSINPSAAVGFINANAWAEITLMAEVYGDKDTGIFGTLDWDI